MTASGNLESMRQDEEGKSRRLCVAHVLTTLVLFGE